MAGKLAERLQKLFSRAGREKKQPPKETMLILFLSGILIFVIMLPTGKDNNSYRKKQTGRSVTATDDTGKMEDSGGGQEGTLTDNYKEGLERELEAFLSGVAGVGEVDVLIHIKSSQEYIVEKDVPVSSAVSGDSSEIKKEETTVYTRNEQGQDVPFISRTKSPEVDGVVVAAQGASDETVRLQITRLVMALYGVEANKVEVLKKE